MIHSVLSVKGNSSYVCQQIDDSVIMKFKCGNCQKGILFIWYGDNRQGFNQDRKKCKVCNSKFKILEVLR